MRYFKGAIAISPTQDLPLLRQVMYSKFVTQTQLWQFMRHSGIRVEQGLILVAREAPGGQWLHHAAFASDGALRSDLRDSIVRPCLPRRESWHAL